jgi:hypothetical protein
LQKLNLRCDVAESLAAGGILGARDLGALCTTRPATGGRRRLYYAPLSGAHKQCSKRAPNRTDSASMQAQGSSFVRYAFVLFLEVDRAGIRLPRLYTAPVGTGTTAFDLSE